MIVRKCIFLAGKRNFLKNFKYWYCHYEMLPGKIFSFLKNIIWPLHPFKELANLVIVNISISMKYNIGRNQALISVLLIVTEFLDSF